MEHSFLPGAHAFLILHSPSSHLTSPIALFSVTVMFSPQDWCSLDFCLWVYLFLPHPILDLKINENPSILVSKSCHSKLPQIERLKIIVGFLGGTSGKQHLCQGK